MNKIVMVEMRGRLILTD